MKTKFELSESDIREAVTEWISQRQKINPALIGNVHLHSTPGRSQHDQVDGTYLISATAEVKTE